MKTHRITPSRRGETFFGPIQKNRGRHVLKPTIGMMALSQNAPCGVSTRQKNPHLRSVNAGFSSSRSLPDTFCDSAMLAILIGRLKKKEKKSPQL